MNNTLSFNSINMQLSKNSPITLDLRFLVVMAEGSTRSHSEHGS